ncbi:hypothetical protein EGW08_007213 [Elysia chlorotica]|uniref:SAM-dependent MTase RsmB/NOP-type domain-containing protein n=1 Tax=Elysia chlorotica TaxID=188477 RepID=A0A3S1HS48_ELYCH|nr:hypothetical protein EGW08_007213 [Elysia chlorotica]
MMSPTVKASSLQPTDNPLYQLAQARKKFDVNMSSSHSPFSSVRSEESVTAPPHRQPTGYAADYARVSAPSSRPRADDWFDEGRASREEEDDEEKPVLSAAKLVHLRSAPSRDRRFASGHSSPDPDEAAAQKKPTFPDAASVSLPTSSTALEYLLHEHSSDRCASNKHDNSIGTGSRFSSTTTTSTLSFSSLLPSAVGSNTGSDYLSSYYRSLASNSRENVADRSNNTANTNTMMTKAGAGSSEHQEGWATTRKPLSVRGKHSAKSISQQFFQVEPCLFTHRMFIRAAKIFQVLKSEDTDTIEAKASKRRRGEPEAKQKIPDMDFRNAQEQIKTFELTFATLKYQEIFRDILEKTGFFHEFSNLRSDFSLVCIILYDLQSRKFQKRTPLPEELERPSAQALEDAASSGEYVCRADHLDDVCMEIENALYSRKTRLQSSFAKERIKRNAPSIEHLLPEQVRHKDETKSINPVFCWVNQMKTSLENILESLRADGFEELERDLEISEQTKKVFRRDPHCSDLLVFPPNFNMYFKESDWVRNGQLVQQDKSSCLAPQTLHLLLGIDQDVIHVNVGTGMTTAHVASLLRHRSPHSHIWGFEPEDAERTRRAAKNLEFLGVKNARIIPDHFLNADPEDSKFKNVRVIMITANCSKSAITSPVQFIVSEGEDMQILGELSQADSNLSRIRELTHEHEKLLKHALKFSRVQAVVYTTRSRYQAENEQVVNQALEAIQGPQQGNQHGKRAPFKLSPPVLPFSGDEIGAATGLVDGKFARFRPSDRSNGCFVAIISREPDDPKEAAKSAIARARSKGMLDKKDAQSPREEADNTTAASGKSRVKNRKLNGSEAKSVGSGLKQKLSHHKAAAAVGARLYQAGLISRMEQITLRPRKPEHIKVIKHPAPFSKSKALRL